MSEAKKQDYISKAYAFEEFRLKRRTLRLMRKTLREKENKVPAAHFISSHGGKSRKQKDMNLPA